MVTFVVAFSGMALLATPFIYGIFLLIFGRHSEPFYGNGFWLGLTAYVLPAVTVTYFLDRSWSEVWNRFMPVIAPNGLLPIVILVLMIPGALVAGYAGYFATKTMKKVLPERP